MSLLKSSFLVAMIVGLLGSAVPKAVDVSGNPTMLIQDLKVELRPIDFVGRSEEGSKAYRLLQ
jgi:hypothetical protein